MSAHRRLFVTALALGASIAIGCGADARANEHGPDHAEPDEGHPREVRLDPSALARAGIELGAVERSELGGGTLVPAEVEPDPAFTAHVSAIVASRISAVEVRLGDRVRAGQRLAVLASSDVGTSRAALAEARVRRDAAREARDRQAQLVEAGIAARRGLVEAEAQLAAIEAEIRGLSGGLDVIGRGGGASAFMTAPIDGVIVTLHATVGEVVEPGASLFTITDPSHVWVVGHLPELDLALAEVGVAGTLLVPALPGRRWRGHVDFVAPALDPETRTLRLRFHLDEPDPALRAGLFGRVMLAPPSAADAPLVIPSTALARIDGLDVVFVPSDASGLAFRPVPVQLGRRDGELFEVTSGLEEGERVVLRGAFTLRSELARDELAGHED